MRTERTEREREEGKDERIREGGKERKCILLIEYVEFGIVHIS